MPLRRQIRRKAGKKIAYRKKKNYGKRKAKYNSRTTSAISRQKFIPDRFFTKLTYQSAIYSAPLSITTVSSSALFRGNSVYDPEYAAGGGQPLGFDALKTMYGYYRVHKSKITMYAFPPSSTASSRFRMTIVPLDRPSVIPQSDPYWQSVAGLPHSKMRFAQAAVQGYSKDSILSNQCMTKVALGLKSIMYDQEFITPIDRNPIEASLLRQNPSWYWLCTVWNEDQAVTQTLDVTYKIDYYVEFCRPTVQHDFTLYGDPDGTNDVPTAMSGTYNTYQPSFGGSGTSSWALAGSL